MSILINNEIKWAIGLIEADGYIGFNHNGNKKWIVTLKVSLSSYNARAVYKLKKIIGHGSISWSNGMVTWKITNKQTMKKWIIPLLEEFNFRGSKYYEMKLLKEAINVMESSKSKDEKHEILSKLKVESKKRLYRITPIMMPEIKVSELLSMLAREPYDLIEEIIKYNKEKDEVLIELISDKTIFEIIDPWWLAGFIEGDGSFKINSRHQIVFELGQKYNTFIVWLIHRRLKIKSKMKIRKNSLDSPGKGLDQASSKAPSACLVTQPELNGGIIDYTMLSTKDGKSITLLITLLKGKLLGIKSFEYSIWSRAFRTKKLEKKKKAKDLLEKIRARRYKKEKIFSP